MKTKVADRSVNGIIAKADTIADALIERIECDKVYVSLANNDTLFSIGITGALGPDNMNRKHIIGDTVCGFTIARNERLVLEDARLDEELSDVPFVESGGIVAYLGQPLCDESAKPIGAICAVSSKPKKWTDTDILNLQNSCKEIEQLLATEMLSRQIEEFSGALLDYDNVLLALAHNLDLMASVHNASGDLLFATNKLLQHLPPASLEKAVAQQDPKEDLFCLPPSENVVDLRTQAKFAPRVRVSSRSGQAECWGIDVLKSSDTMLFVSWTKLGTPKAGA